MFESDQACMFLCTEFWGLNFTLSLPLVWQPSAAANPERLSAYPDVTKGYENLLAALANRKKVAGFTLRNSWATLRKGWKGNI